MKKNWMNTDLVELNINATAQNPTDKLAVDDFQPGQNGQPGIFHVGVGNASGPVDEIIYYPKQQ